MTSLRIVYAAIAVCGVVRAEQATASELLSIRGVELGARNYVSAYHVDTWGVRVLEVCRVLPGWTITAGNGGDPSGVLAGEANIGVAFLDHAHVNELDKLFLVDVMDYRAVDRRNGGTTYPASFSGTVSIGTYGNDTTTHKRRLKPASFVRTPADQCPAR